MSDSVGNQQRAQSELLGIVLLFALVLTVSLTVVVVGGSALGDIQSSTTTESAEVTMSEFQSKAAQVGSGTGSIQEISFAESSGGQAPMSEASGASVQSGNEDDVTVNESSGTVDIEIRNSSGHTISDPSAITMGQVVYERDGERVAYQGGGVFRKNSGSSSSSMVSPPNFQYQYRNGVPTLSMPVTTVSGSVSDNEFSLEQAGSDKLFPVRSSQNPIQPGQKVRITIESEYYQAWGELFRDRTNGDVDPKPASNEVILTLNGPDTSSGPASAGGVVTSDIGTLKLQNHAYADSYDSGSHSSTTGSISPNSDAPIYVDGVFDPGNQVFIDGYVHATGRMIYDSSNGNQEDNRIAGETVTGGNPGDNDPSWMNGKLEFRDIFSTKDDLSVSGSNGNPDNRVVFEDDVFVGGDVIDEASSTLRDGGRFRNVRVEGDLYVQGNVDLEDGDNVKIEGDIVAGGSVDVGSHVQNDSIESDADPPDPLEPQLPATPNVGGIISDMDSATEYSQDAPSNASDIESNGGCKPTACVLTEGTHRVKNIRLEKNGGTLKLDTSSGPIDLYVEDEAQGDRSIYMGQDTAILVKVSNKATIYTESGVYVGKKSKIRTTPIPYVAPNLEMKVQPGATFDTVSPSGNDRTEITGLFNGSHPSNGALFSLDDGTQIYGGVVGDPTGPSGEGLREDVVVHFDEALLGGDSSINPITGSADDVAFIQITQTRLEADE